MSFYGLGSLEETLGYFEAAAASADWEMREIAQMLFRKLLAKHPDEVRKFLLRLTVSSDANLRRFVAETLRPVQENKWFYRHPEYPLSILRNLFKESSPFPRTSVGNNLSDLSRRLPDTIYGLVKELVDSGDDNSYWIAYRACRNLVKLEPVRVMNLLKVDEYRYKKRHTGEVTTREIEAKSILRKHKKIDSWFLSRYNMNLYRGCSHNCVYCDGRSEGYYVEGEFGEDVTAKTNAIEVLSRELDPRRKRRPLERGFVMVGGGVGDSYQPIEQKYELTRRTLQVLAGRHLPVHMLTKSTLIERDIDILKKINAETKAIVSFSFSSVDDDISRVVEPGVPSPSRRLTTIGPSLEELTVTGITIENVKPLPRRSDDCRA